LDTCNWGQDLDGIEVELLQFGDALHQSRDTEQQREQRLTIARWSPTIALEGRNDGRIPREVQFGKVAQLFVCEALFGLEKAKTDGTAAQALEECQQALLVVGPDRPDAD